MILKTIKFNILSSLFIFFGITLYAQNSLTADQALQALKDGNERFVKGTRTYLNLDNNRISETNSNGQYPFATIITCSDSRVPVEHIFDAGIGDLFVIRVAGNVVDIDEAGSIEYGVDHLNTPVFVVLGHSSCGAVTAVVKNAELHGNIPKLVDNIQPAVKKAREEYGNTFTDDLLEASIKNNVWKSIEDLLKVSHTTLELVKQKKLKIIGAVYHLNDGHVEWFGEHPQQKQLINL